MVSNTFIRTFLLFIQKACQLLLYCVWTDIKNTGIAAQVDSAFSANFERQSTKRNQVCRLQACYETVASLATASKDWLYRTCILVVYWEDFRFRWNSFKGLIKKLRLWHADFNNRWHQSFNIRRDCLGVVTPSSSIRDSRHKGQVHYSYIHLTTDWSLSTSLRFWTRRCLLSSVDILITMQVRWL